MNSYLELVVVSWLALAPAALAQLPTGALRGTLTTEDGRPFAGAYVAARRDGLPPNNDYAVTTKAGTFAIDKLPAGTYSLCVQVPTGGYLDPCDWSGKPEPVRLAAGQVNAGLTLRIRKGSIVRVRVNDSGKLLERVKGRPAPSLVLGVFDSNHIFHPVVSKARDAAGMDFQVTVPLDTDLKFYAASSAARLLDEAGLAPSEKENGHLKDFRHASGDPAPRSFTFTAGPGK